MTTEYAEAIYAARKHIDEKVKADPLHWLQLAGLFWMEEGENTFGSAENNAIALPNFPQPYCGRFNLKNGIVTFQPADDLTFTSDRPNPETRAIFTDADQQPDLIHIGTLSIKIISRGKFTLARIWDRAAEAGKMFEGFKHYAVDEKYRVTAKYIRYDPPKKIIRLDMIGTETEEYFLGRVEFKLNGVDCALAGEKSGASLLFHFTDETNKDTTYGAGRRVIIPMPESEEIILDFNRAINWPCAYTAFATCPVAPQANHLKIKIEAGEKKYF